MGCFEFSNGNLILGMAIHMYFERECSGRGIYGGVYQKTGKLDTQLPDATVNQFISQDNASPVTTSGIRKQLLGKLPPTPIITVKVKKTF